MQTISFSGYVPFSLESCSEGWGLGATPCGNQHHPLFTQVPGAHSVLSKMLSPGKVLETENILRMSPGLLNDVLWVAMLHDMITLCGNLHVPLVDGRRACVHPWVGWCSMMTE